MKQDTQNKFAAILAAAQSKVNATEKNAIIQQIKQEEPDPEVITPEEQQIINEVANSVKSKMISFYIHWSETIGRYDEQTFTTWNKANEALTWCYNQHEGLGYTKVKVTVKWANGKEITDRIDCSDNSGDFCAKRETIGQYLSKQNSVMYASNLQQGERITLSFEDEKAPEEKTIYCAPVTFDVPVKESKPIEQKLQIVDYSEKAFAVIGETKPIRDLLSNLGGKFNAYLKCGAGWIFSKRQLEMVKMQLAL